MAWFKKKKEDFGDEDFDSELPPLPPLPGEGNSADDDFGPIDFDDNALPSMPEAAKGLGNFGGLPSSSNQQRRQPTIRPMALPKMSLAGGAPGKAKVFVRLDKYKDIMRTIEGMQGKLNELQKTIDNISSIKQKESEIVNGWHSLLSDAKNKVDEINQKLLRPQE